MKYGSVSVFVLIVVGSFTWASFGGVPVVTQLERLYYLTPVSLGFVFSYHWYRVKELTDKVEKLERSIGAAPQ